MNDQQYGNAKNIIAHFRGECSAALARHASWQKSGYTLDAETDDEVRADTTVEASFTTTPPDALQVDGALHEVSHVAVVLTVNKSEPRSFDVEIGSPRRSAGRAWQLPNNDVAWDNVERRNEAVDYAVSVILASARLQTPDGDRAS